VRQKHPWAVAARIAVFRHLPKNRHQCICWTAEIDRYIVYRPRCAIPVGTAVAPELWAPKTDDMTRVECTISSGLWQLLQEHAAATRQSVSSIVNRALADYFEAAHDTPYQISTSTALVEGIYQGAVRVGNLREHGDLGLGTFEELDGEMVIVGGHFFQVRCCGSVREVDDSVLTPFAVITRFTPDTTVTLNQCSRMADLTFEFDSLRHSDNVFYALRVDGKFEHVRTRAMCRTKEGEPLVKAAAVQSEFNFTDISGTRPSRNGSSFARLPLRSKSIL
jgi:acetolactate decarboxylase